MAVYNLGTARGNIEIDTNDLKNADIALRSAGTSMIGFGAAALGAFGYVIGVGAQFEKEMSFVSAVTGASKEELDKLSEAAIELGKQGPFGPREVAAGFVDLAKAGLSAEEIINGVGEAAVNLAAAGDIPFTEAAETLVNVMRTFNIDAANVESAIDSIAGAANASTVDISDMATSLKYAGAPAALLGLTVEELNAAIGILGNRGIRGSTAGTSLRRIFLQLAAPTKAATDRMKELGLITEDGANAFFKANGEAKDLAEIFEILQTATAGLNDKEKLAALNDIFGARAVSSALILMEQGAEGFQAFTDQMNGTSAADVAAERMDNLAGAIQKLKAAIEATFIQAGSPFQDFLKNLVLILREVVLWFGNLPRPLQTFILGSIAAIGVLSLLSGAFLLTVGNMVRAVRVIGELGKAAQTIGPLIRGFALAMRGLSLAFLSNPIVLIIAAIVALGVAFYLLYTRVEGFRKFIDNLWQDIQSAWDKVLEVFRGAGDFIGNIFGRIQDIIGGAIDWIGDRLRGIILGVQAFKAAFSGEGITTAGNKIVGVFERLGVAARSVYLFFRNFGDSLRTIGRFFANLAGIIGRGLVNSLKRAGEFIADFFAELPRRAGYAIGFVIGRFIRLSYEVPKFILTMAVRAIKAMVQFGVQLVTTVINIFTTVVTTVFNFLTQLPGILLNVLTTLVTTLFNFGVQFVQTTFNIFLQVIQTVISWLTQLPGLVLNFFTSALNFVIGMVPRFFSTATDIGNSIVNGIIDIITGLPGLIGDILGKVIDAFTGLIQRAFNAAKDFAGGLWEGFKDGLGINSPSFIEEALFAIQGTAAAATTDLRSSLRTMQGLSRSIPVINSGALGLPTPAAAALTANGGGMQYNQNAPLIGQATIKDERDAVTLARVLAAEQAKQARAKGRVVTSGIQ